jgi:hypothetical protein
MVCHFQHDESHLDTDQHQHQLQWPADLRQRRTFPSDPRQQLQAGRDDHGGRKPRDSHYRAHRLVS